jgi:uncharacterized membrane protein YkgB
VNGKRFVSEQSPLLIIGRFGPIPDSSVSIQSGTSMASWKPQKVLAYFRRLPLKAHTLIPFISNGPLTSWMYPVFGLQGASWFLGVSEWLFGALIFLGFWNKPVGVLGALGSCVTFIMTITIIPFMPDGWNAGAGGFPAMQGNVAFLMKDVVLFAVSFYLLKQDADRASLSTASTKTARNSTIA